MRTFRSMVFRVGLDRHCSCIKANANGFGLFVGLLLTRVGRGYSSFVLDCKHRRSSLFPFVFLAVPEQEAWVPEVAVF